jgi:hypothetical protein
MKAALALHLPALALALSVSTAAAVEATSRALPLSFNKCLGAIIYVGVQIGVAPINIVETSVTRMARFDTEDGSVLITCSRPHQKMIITRIIFE